MTEPNRGYVSVDIEASGPIPGEYSMLAIGACLVEDPTVGFYVELKPISEQSTPEAMAVCGMDLEELKKTGLEPADAMGRFEEWIAEKAGDLPLFCAYPVSFDWMFVAWYFHKYLGRNPFGVSGLDMRSAYLGRTGAAWADTRKDRMLDSVRPKTKLTHNALHDARDQAMLLRRILALPGPDLEREGGRPKPPS